MKVSRKFVSIFLSLLLICFSFISISVSAVTYRVYGGFRFSYLADDTAMIAEYTGDSSTMVIPDTLLDHPVSSIGPGAFQEDDFVEHIVFGNNFVSIASFAFDKSTALKDVTFPDSLNTIVYNAFNGCTALTFVDFANANVDTIERYTFSNCPVLSDVILNNNVIKVDEMAFAYDSSLQRIYIPSSVTVIDDFAFYNTPNVTVYCYSDSYALKYAVSHNLNYCLLDGINKSELETSISTADETFNLIDDLYIPRTVESLQSAYEQAVSVYKNPFTTQDEVNNANDLLTNAINSLKQYEFGDVDLNEDINIRDATLIQLYCASLSNFNDTQLILADIDRNEDVNVKDATIIQLKIANLI